MRVIKIFGAAICLLLAFHAAIVVLVGLTFGKLHLPFAICTAGFAAFAWWFIATQNSSVPKEIKRWLIPLACLLMALFVGIELPAYVAAAKTTAKNACVNNLRQISGAKQQWALEHQVTNGIPTVQDLTPYLGRGEKGEFPVCPQGGTYIIGPLNEDPRCSLADSTWPNKHALNYTNTWWGNFKSAYRSLIKQTY